MKLHLTMTVDNAAFFDEENGRDGSEVARILRRVANDVDATSLTGGERGRLRDYNGNDVGEWRLTTR